MWLESLSVDGYGSLKGLHLDLKPFSVFVGANGQGKSLILEAIGRFFADFSPTAGPASAGVTDSLWFRRETEQPITFDLTFALESDELSALLPKDPHILERLDAEKSGDISRLRVKRLLPSTGPWKTEILLLGKIPIISNDAPMAQDAFSDFLASSAFPDLKMYFFTAGSSRDNITGDRLLVHAAKKKAYTSNPALDELVRKGLVESSTEYSGKAYQQWATENGYTTSAPTPTDYASMGLVATDYVQKIVTNLAQLRTKFKLIPAARDVRAVSGQRISLLDPAIVQNITSMSIDRRRSVEKRWERYRETIQSLLRRRLEANPSQVLLKEGDFGLQPAEVGGGEQVLMGLVIDTLDTEAITAIEEPENHLHPELQRSLLKFFSTLSERNQVLLTTHSPVFASRLDAGSVFLVSRNEEGVTTAEPVGTVNVNRVINELGIRPADLFEHDTVVFVEGQQDVRILTSWAGKLIRDQAASIGFIDAEGWTSMEYYANARVVQSGRLKANAYVIFDGDTEAEEKRRAIKTRLVDQLQLPSERIITLPKSSIESYLLVPEAIGRAFRLTLSVGEVSAAIKAGESKKNKKHVLDQILKRGGITSGYDTEAGQRIAHAMNEGEISPEVREIFQKLSDSAPKREDRLAPRP